MNGILVPVQVENISTRKDKTVKLVLGTQELSPAKAGELFNLLNTVGMAYLCPKGINQNEIDQVDRLDPEFEGKTQSQRIRSVLFKLFQQDSEGFKDFDNYYKGKTEKVIEHFKAKITQ
jgi:hypothetical protein